MKFSIFVAVATYAVAVSARGHPHGIFNARTGTTTDLSACNTDSDCASGCCGFTSAICEGPCVALQRDGCGHGNALSNSNAAAALGSCSFLVSSYKPSAAAGAAAPAATAAANTNSASSGSAATSNNASGGTSLTRGTQFITGACSVNNDCVSGCCVASSKLCGATLAQAHGAADCTGGVALPNLDA
ncbi:hypothetical protein BDP27DRAFT_1427058 [Rhodocollybia butyracea]|uniref:Biotrophy-associated secreted protein 2 n=1 Tax=Rhodocollybia butyracea TaxID=206335 RepID=A0A9P5PH28_9AGAR|nr:hypothetical protein BDP27DRAFT_1427058 [Rhodocollybia butyracea]